MCSLKNLFTLGKLVLLVQSAIAGVIFLAISITALVNPAFVETVSSFDCFARSWIIAQYWLPNMSTHAVVVCASFLLGAFNTIIVLATSCSRIRR